MSLREASANCPELDDRLPVHEMDQIGAHVRDCEWCQQEMEMYEAAKKIFGES